MKPQTKDSFGNPVYDGDNVFQYDMDNIAQYGKAKYEDGTWWVKFPEGIKMIYQPEKFFRADCVTNNVKPTAEDRNMVVTAAMVITVMLGIAIFFGYLLGKYLI